MIEKPSNRPRELKGFESEVDARKIGFWKKGEDEDVPYASRQRWEGIVPGSPDALPLGASWLLQPGSPLLTPASLLPQKVLS